MNYSTKHAKTHESGAIQAQIDLQQLVRFHVADCYPGGSAIVVYLPSFNADYPEHHILPDYYRNPVSGDRGGAIKFIQKLKGCSYERAVGYLDGWLDRSAWRPSLVARETKQIQLPLFSLHSIDKVAR